MMKEKYYGIIYQNKDILAIDKPAGIVIFPENSKANQTLIDHLLEDFPNLKNVGHPPRYGIIHRLDKDTSGIVLVAKNNKTLDFLQKQFQERRVEKKYLALVAGEFKTKQGEIRTLIGRSPKNRLKQKIYPACESSAKGRRQAVTEYRVLQNFKNYTLVEAQPRTGRKHQIRAHFAYLNHPVAGDKTYGFKNQPCPEGLKRQFLHASYLKIELPDGQKKEFSSVLPKNLKKVLNSLEKD